MNIFLEQSCNSPQALLHQKRKIYFFCSFSSCYRLVSFDIFNQKEILKQENATQMKLDCKFQVNELVMHAWEFAGSKFLQHTLEFVLSLFSNSIQADLVDTTTIVSKIAQNEK